MTIGGSLDDVAQHAEQVGRNLVLVTVESETTIPGLADEVARRLPHAEILAVTPRARDRELNVVSMATATGAEPNMRELFRDYVSRKPTRQASAELVVETFEAVLACARSDELPRFEETQELLLATPEAVETATLVTATARDVLVADTVRDAAA
jgi:hypothetical protein